MFNTLGDIGEREIIRTILPKFAASSGDDCAAINLGNTQLIVTTDPVPEPAAKLLGNDANPYWMGWLLVTINASDLAAAGAAPLAFLAAVEAPPEMLADDFEKFLLGVSQACTAERLAYIGGNLREGKKLTAVGTAIGQAYENQLLHRNGAKEGDIIVSVGRGGIFWQDALIIRSGGVLEDKDSSPLFRPKSQLEAMHLLTKYGLVSAAIDNSDGLLPTLTQLASINSLTVQLNLDQLPIPNHASKLEIDPARLWLGWGDWNVIAAIHPNLLEQALKIAADANVFVAPIGEFRRGNAEVLIKRSDILQTAPRLESERFAKDSWFASGIQGYVDLLLSVELP